MNRMFTGLRSLSFALIFTAVTALGPGLGVQAQAPPNEFRLSIPNGDLHLVLLEYEKYTGKKVIRDNAVEGGKVTVETSGTVTKEEAVQFIGAESPAQRLRHRPQAVPTSSRSWPLRRANSRGTRESGSSPIHPAFPSRMRW